MNNRTYAIIDKNTWEEGLSASGAGLDYFYTLILETSPETLRYSLCGNAFIIKTNNMTHVATLTTFAEAYNINYEIYNHDQILQVLSTSAWSMPMVGLI